MPTSKRIAWSTLAMICVLSTYFLYATNFFGFRKTPLHKNGSGAYAAQADAFLQGRIQFDDIGDYRLAGLARDVSLYHDKYYLYWGPVPPVLLYLPYKLLTGRDLPDAAATLIFITVAFLACVALYRVWMRFLFPNLSEQLLAIAILTTGFANLGLHLLNQSRIYEVSCSASICFFMLGLYGFFRWFCDETSSNRTLVWSFGTMGLTFLCRPTPALAIGALTIVAVVQIYRREKTIQKALKEWASALSLLVTCLAIYGFYNWLRFDSIFETGFNYQVNRLLHKGFYLCAVSRNLYVQFLQPPHLSLSPPFLSAGGYDSIALSLCGLAGNPGNGVSLLYLCPYLSVALGGAILQRMRRKQAVMSEITSEVFQVLCITLVLAILPLLFYPYNDLRYQADYTSPALLLATLFWFFTLTPNKAKLPWAMGAFLVSASFSIVLGLLASFM